MGMAAAEAAGGSTHHLQAAASVGQTPRYPDMALERLMTFFVKKVFGVMEALSMEPSRISSHDRAILEEMILPYFENDQCSRRILFVGCSAYTQSYEKFFKNKEYWTIDYKRVKRKYGSQNHITDSVTNLANHFPNNYFHVIIMNGVIGFGLDKLDEIEKALDACFDTLDRGGILMLGWNDHPTRMPIDIGAIQALKRFHQYCFEPLQTCHVRTEGRSRHTFSFYRRD